MKKVLLAFAILGFVACNNEGEKTEATTDSVAAPAVDTAAVDTVTTDSVAADTAAVL
jgi:hypothetical protein